ncbi:MAG: hypothetical protein ACFFD4_28035 [Candidatus Odinarchaeota archaeon]
MIKSSDDIFAKEFQTALLSKKEEIKQIVCDTFQRMNPQKDIESFFDDLCSSYLPGNGASRIVRAIVASNITYTLNHGTTFVETYCLISRAIRYFQECEAKELTDDDACTILYEYARESHEPTDSIAERWACRGSFEPLQARLISLSPEKDYVTLECIGTAGCSTSPVPCGQWLNSSEGKEQCCWQQESARFSEILCNLGDVDHALPRRVTGSFLACKHAKKQNIKKWRTIEL